MTNNAYLDAEKKMDEQFALMKTPLSPEQEQAILAYKEVIKYLGIDVISDLQNPVLSPDKVITDSNYLTLTEDQLMYYIGVLSGLRPYLGENLINAKAKGLYATLWRKFNEVGYKVNYRKGKLREEIEKLEKKILENVANEKIKEKSKKAVNLAVKKHYTEDNLKDESSWRNYVWSKIEAEKIRKAELLNFYTSSIDNLIVALKERVRYMNPEKGQSKFGDQVNTPRF